MARRVRQGQGPYLPAHLYHLDPAGSCTSGLPRISRPRAIFARQSTSNQGADPRVLPTVALSTWAAIDPLSRGLLTSATGDRRAVGGRPEIALAGCACVSVGMSQFASLEFLIRSGPVPPRGCAALGAEMPHPGRPSSRNCRGDSGRQPPPRPFDPLPPQCLRQRATAGNCG